MREVYLFGPYRFDVDARRLTRDGNPVAVTLRGFDLLLVLVRNAGKAVPRSRLLEEVWRDVVVEEGNLDTHVSALRKALSGAPGAIETVRGFGFRFAAPVSIDETADPPSGARAPRESESVRVARASPTTQVTPIGAIDERLAEVAASEWSAANPSDSGAGTALGAPVEARTAEVERLAPPRRRPSWLALATIAGVLSLAALGVLRWAARESEIPLEREATVTGLPSLAVLPFENLSRREDDAWLASALREVLSSEASRGGGVSALPGDTVARLAAEIGMPAGATLPGAAVAKFRERLGVDLLLAGTYLVVGPARDLRVDLQLYDASTGKSRRIWNESGRVDDLLALVSRAGDGLRAEIGSPPGNDEPPTAAVFPASSEALRFYTTGLAELRQFRPLQALAQFRRAIEAEPAFALARGALAGVLGQLGHEREARTEAKRALELAATLPESDRAELQGRLFALSNQWPQAVAVRRRQQERDPESLDLGLELARALTNANEAGEAVRVLARLASMPLPKGADPRIDLERGWASRRLGDFAAMRTNGEATVKKGRALDSDLIVAEGLVLVSWADLTLNHWRDGLGPCEEGMAIASRLEHGFLRARHQGLCGWNHLNLGEFDEAERDFAAALELARANGDLDQSADFLYGLGMLAANRARPAEQLRLNREQLAVTREAGDVEAEVQALGSVADAELESGELTAAERTAREAIALARETVSPGRLSNVVTTLAAVRQARGDTQEARSLFEEAIAMRRERTPARAGLLYIEVGWTELAAGRPDAALVAADAAEKLLSADDELAFTRVAALRADAFARLGRRDDALGQLARVDEKQPQLGLVAGLAAGLDLARAQALEHLGRKAEAAALWREIAARPPLAELLWVQLECAYRLARQRAETEATPDARAELERVAARAREAKFGALLGETL